MTEVTAKDQVIAAIETYFTIDKAPATVIAEIIDDEFDGLETVIEEAKERAQERIDAGNEEAQERADADDLDLLIEEEIAAYLSDFTLNEGQGNTGDMYELENGQEFMFGEDAACDKEAEADFDNLIDDMINDPDWVKANVVPSWESGETRAEFVTAGASLDSLARYNGDYSTVTVDGAMWHWFRTN